MIAAAQTILNEAAMADSAVADSLSQDDQTGRLTTPFGDDVLVLSQMNAAEALSELFELHIEALSLQANLDFNSALGRDCTVKLMTVDDHERYFNGVMTEAHWAGGHEDLYAYEFVLRPWLWLLTRTSDCRIFHDMKVIDIVTQVFSDRGFSDFRDETKSDPPPKLEYCVQYRETDFNFVCRLMEEHGIYYFFEHSDGKHTLVLAAGKSSHKPVPSLASLPFIPVEHGGRRALQCVETWSRRRLVESGKFTLNDYDYNAPSKNLKADSTNSGGYEHGSMEIYDYPGDYKVLGDGTTLAKVKVGAAQSLDNRRTSTGAAPSLFPGALITLKDCPIKDENQQYLVTHCTHFVEGQSYRSGGAVGSFSYSGSYEMTPSSHQFRAPLITPKPNIAGYQSALVIRDKKNEGEEIDVDELGRILVFFYWDREKKNARRIRVAQIWAGSNRGALFVPRVGDEVLVTYEEGDPDRPIVIGSVYNGTNTVPMSLPPKKVKSGILTQSSKGGNGYNMLLFDDTAGSEVVKLRCQYNLMFKALNDQTIEIGVDRTDKVGNNINQTVGNNHNINVNSNYTLTAGQQIVLQVGSSSITITAQSITLQSPQINLTADTEVSISAPQTSITA
jgi:type VI secretion system secreted protein VgrG